MATKKQIEKEMETDPFFAFIGKAIDYCKENKTTVQWVAIAVVGAVLLGVVINNYRSSSTSKDLIAFEQASTAALIQEYLDNHKGGMYYPHALFKKANYAYDDGKYTEALDTYKQILKSYPKHILAAQTKVGIGYAYLAMGNYDEAGKTFAAFIEKHADNPFAGDARLNLARCMMKLGKYDQAQQVVSQFIEESPNSVLAPEAEKLLPEINRNL